MRYSFVDDKVGIEQPKPVEGPGTYSLIHPDIQDDTSQKVPDPRLIKISANRTAKRPQGA